MRIFNEIVPTNDSGDMSKAVLTSDAVHLDHISTLAIQAVYTGSPVGTLKLQANIGQATWTDITPSAVAVTAAGDFMWNVPTSGYTSIRLVYTKTSGTGALVVAANGKGF